MLRCRAQQASKRCQTAIKREMRAICKAASTAPHKMVSVAKWEQCLKRDLDVTDEDNFKLFEACHNQILTKAVGAAERSNASHRGHLCLHNGHPPNKKGEFDCCVTPETERMPFLPSEATEIDGVFSSKLPTSTPATKRRASTFGLPKMSFRPPTKSKSGFTGSKGTWTS